MTAVSMQRPVESGPVESGPMEVGPVEAAAAPSAWRLAAMERLVEVVQTLSQARDLTTVQAIVRTAARELTGADGATFVLRDGDKCHYADEDAISPLWKGQRFPMSMCISGWVMLNATPAVIEDIYQDARIPAEAYRPTFVKSLAMVPIRAEKPVGAIGNYWARKHRPSPDELSILQALAHVTSVALENVELDAQLREKLRALEASNAQLSSFAWAASHDLKTPLRGVDHLAAWAVEAIEAGELGQAKEHVGALRQRVRRMDSLLGGILEFAHVERALNPDAAEMADGATLKEDVLALLDVPAGFTIGFSKEFDAAVGPRIALQRVLSNLIDNAIKHHDWQVGAIDVGCEDEGARYVFSVADNGPGVPAEYQARIFEMFQSLKRRDETEGSGLGLSLVKKIVALHGGEIGVESGPGRGAVFRFTWPKPLDVVRGAGAP